MTNIMKNTDDTVEIKYPEGIFKGKFNFKRQFKSRVLTVSCSCFQSLRVLMPKLLSP